MYILGLGGSDHDIAAALIKDDKIVSVIEEERVTRKKYGFNSNLLLGSARKYVLGTENLKLDDVDLIVLDDILPKTASFTIRRNFQKVNHHLLHASSTFFPSPFEEAAILVVDNAGSLIEWNGKKGIECLTYAYGKGNKIEVIDKIIGEKYNEAQEVNGESYQTGDPENSLGYFYKIISYYCGFTFIEKDGFYFTEDGKTMGLAPYGDDRYYAEVRKHVELFDNGQIKIDLYSNKLQDYLASIIKDEVSKEEDMERRACIAYAGQKVLEEALIHAANYLYEKTYCKNLCIAGGVGLNSVANGKILMNTKFENVFVQPASGDSGTALGAALWGYYYIQSHDRKLTDNLIMKNAYFGKEYSDDEILEALKKRPELKYKYSENVAKNTAKLIADGNIIGWFQGGAEYGPRALGHRSIIVNPLLPGMKDYLNARVKFREEFRPFAPSVLYEDQTKYFDIKQYTPYMLIVADVKEEMRSVIPAVTHVDGTARLQSVTKEYNGIYYDLIREFKEITNESVILNTSFNVKGEPIVETPNDAINCFWNTNIDFLAIGSYIVSK